MSTTPSPPDRGSENTPLPANEGVVSTYHEALRTLGMCSYRVVDAATQYHHSPSEETRGLLDALALDAARQLEQCLPRVYETELGRNNEYVAALLQVLKGEEAMRFSATEAVIPSIPFDDIEHDNQEVLDAIYGDLADMLEPGDVSSWENCMQLFERSLECYIDRVTNYTDINQEMDGIIDSTIDTVRREQYAKLALRIGEAAFVVVSGVMAAKLFARLHKRLGETDT